MSKLKGIELEILDKAAVFRNVRNDLNKAGTELRSLVQGYQDERERLQREDWAKKGLLWCFECEEIHSKESVVLLYTEGEEYIDGGRGTYGYAFKRRIRTFCNSCAETIQSNPRGGERRFQCFRVKSEGAKFYIYVSGKWQSISEMRRIEVDIERRQIPESEFSFGKKIECHGWYPLEHLTVEDKEIF